MRDRLLKLTEYRHSFRHFVTPSSERKVILASITEGGGFAVGEDGGRCIKISLKREGERAGPLRHPHGRHLSFQERLSLGSLER